MAVYGIDLGTTLIKLAKLQGENEAVVLMCCEPTVYIGENGEVFVSLAAREMGMHKPERLRWFFPRWIGRESDPGYVPYLVDGREYTPIELTTLFFRRMIELAEEKRGENVHDVLLTCAADIDPQQYEAIVGACEEAGLNVLSVASGSVAMAAGYCVDHPVAGDKVALVLEQGGECSMATLVRISGDEKGNFSLTQIATRRWMPKTGNSWNAMLDHMIISAVSQQYGTSFCIYHPGVAAMLRHQLEEQIMRLDEADEITVTARFGSREYAVKVDAARKSLSQYADAFGFAPGILACLRDAGYTEDMIDLVLPADRRTVARMILDTLTERFGDRVQSDEAAFGAAKGAAIMAGIVKKHAVQDEESDRSPAPEEPADCSELGRKLAEMAERMKALAQSSVLEPDWLVDEQAKAEAGSPEEAAESPAPETVELSDPEGLRADCHKLEDSTQRLEDVMQGVWEQLRRLQERRPSQEDTPERPGE